jgi:hypothetical protein
LVLFECGRSCTLSRLLRASNASVLFECGLRSLELSSSGQQRLCVIRVRASVPRIILFGPAVPLRYSTVGFGPSNYSLRASSASTLFECGFQSLESHLSAISAFILFGYGPLSFESLFRAINALLSSFPKHGSNKPVRMPYVKYEGKSTIGNTRWPGIRIKRALPRNFPYLRYEVCIDGRIECLTLNWASTW